MRPATLLAATAALALVAAPALAKTAPHAKAPSRDAAAAGAATAGAALPANDANTDMRCIVAAGALMGSDDEQLKSAARASIFYYFGRLQGRGDTANVDDRIVELAAKMTSDDITAALKTCAAQFTAANEALQQLSEAYQKRFGASEGAAPDGAAPKQ